MAWWLSRSRTRSETRLNDMGLRMGLSSAADRRATCPCPVRSWSYHLKTLGLSRSRNPRDPGIFFMFLSLGIEIFSVIFYVVTWSKYFIRKVCIRKSEKDLLQLCPCALKEYQAQGWWVTNFNLIIKKYIFLRMELMEREDTMKKWAALTDCLSIFFPSKFLLFHTWLK